jgi:N-acetylglucosaminyl-diphospho-decaprenol L-rhamnosyltransferase
MTDVAVSIVNTSNRELLLRCLETLEADPARRSSVEIVVLDNASTDGSPEAVRRRFPEVRVIEQRHRDGFGANHNTVVRVSRSRYVYILNEDTETPPGTIDALVDHLEAHPQVGAVGPRIVGPDGRQQGSAWRLMTVPVQLVWALTLGQRGAVVSTGSDPKRVGAVSACAMLVRRDVFERAGMFDESYFIFSEEAETARRFQRLGYEMHYLPTVETLHHGQQTTSSVPDRQINEHWRSFDLYVRRWHSPLEARLLRWLTGLGYALATVVAEIGTRLPERIRPAVADAWNPAIYRLHVRNAFRGVRGPGIREAAEDFNRRQGVERDAVAAGS